ncbi:tetraspanin-18 [Typha angustifolia]|uniref:tetraspanin-18 n=1 Tax=Typha angustifolia TaxID=59011 RepID=UPI003C303C90
MRPSFCRSSLAFFIKFLNFLQGFVGISIAIYAIWMLNHWNRQGGDLDIKDLKDLWFVCASMGVGVLLCLIAFTGHVAAEASSGCCLCFYAILTTLLILLEATLAGDLMFNKHWQEDLPYDATGELKNLRAFIEDNMDICKWVGISVIVIQGFSLFFATVLRSMVSTRRVDYDSDEDFVVIRRPLLNPQGVTPYATTSVDNKGFHSDIWSSRMRQKYGLNQNEFAHNVAEPKASIP